MESMLGKKIFVLYPDDYLRKNVFYGSLRNSFEIYFIYDYEKIKTIAAYYPASIVVLNLINNDLIWLPEELSEELRELDEDVKPLIIALYDKEVPDAAFCTESLQFSGQPQSLAASLEELFIRQHAKGRRNLVRYGGYGDSIARIRIDCSLGKRAGIVHDVSPSGLSCSVESSEGIPGGEKILVELILECKSLKMEAVKILSRKVNGKVIDILKFDDAISESTYAALLEFIYNSLDTAMKDFISRL